MDALTIIQYVTVAGRLPCGWVQLSGPDHDTLSSLGLELAAARNGAVVHVNGTTNDTNGVYSVEAQGHVVFDVVEAWLADRLFDVVVIDHFDGVHPAVHWTAAHRAWWIGENVKRLRPVLRRTGATIVAICHSPRSGGHTFQAEISLRLHVTGQAVFAGGRASRVGLPALDLAQAGVV